MYKRRPMVGRSFVMKCVPEPENTYDCNAVKVIAPNVDELANVDFMGIETRGPPHQQYVSDIVGLTIGHVPRQLCNIISIPMRVHRTLKHAICIYMGEMVHDHQGPKLKVMYLLKFDPSISLQTIANHMQMYNCVPSENFYC